LSDGAEANVGTPWGRASELKKRKLAPGSGLPREQVIQNQRERLFGAAVAVVSVKGFEATTVADLIEVAGVSRGDFYKHFANKAGCVAAAAEALQDAALEVLADGRRGGAEPVEPSFERLIALISSQPAAARLYFVELHAAGRQGDEVAERGFDALAARLAAELDQGGRLSSGLARALVGGLCKVIHTRLCRGQVAELGNLAGELWRWSMSVQAPPRALEVPRRARGGAQAARFEGYTPAERIARATAAVVAEKGYGSMNTDDIAARAAISLSTFYEHFADKRDAVLGALEMSGAQIMALAAPAARRAGDWQEGVRALYEAICAYFVAEPEMAELAMVGVYGVGPAALARRDRVIDSLTEMLAPGFDENPEAAEVSAEAATAAVYALMREQVRKAGPPSLAAAVPLATYITLVGFVGPERACAVANGEGRKR
jgi:AcrR family transcriptional regulator